MGYIKASTYEDDPSYTLYEVEGERFIGGPEMMITTRMDGIEYSRYVTRTCRCCNQPKSETYGPVARSWEEVVECKWVVTEEEFKAWSKSRR